MKSLKLWWLCSFILIFVACSGDDEEIKNDPPEPAQVNTGVFTDSEVAGLYYETETKSGITNSAGEFDYLEGETVTFYVGNIELGSALASPQMTPVTIASTENADLQTPEVQNIAAFLQTLDSDGDPSNGILIESAVADAISLTSIDFTKPVVQILGEVVAEIYQTTGIELEPIYPEEAAAHLAETLNTTYEPTNLLYTNFIPAIESWITSNQPRTSVQWIHEIDASGKLVKSTRYEKRPYRPAAVYNYKGFNEAGLPTTLELIDFSQGIPNRTTNREILYNSSNEVTGIKDYSEEGDLLYTWEFINFDSEGRITEASFYNANGEFVHREIYSINDNGNTFKRTRYSTESGTNSSDVKTTYDYTFSSFGEIATMTVETEQFGLEEWEYIYREDNTLQERIRISVDLHGRNRTDHYFYDEQEKKVRQKITVGDFVSDYVEFYDNGDPKRAETYYKGFLYEIVEWQEDGSSVWKTIDEEDGSYKIEYKDENENVLKTENYDADGNLVSTT